MTHHYLQHLMNSETNTEENEALHSTIINLRNDQAVPSAVQTTHGCACGSVLEVIEDMRLNMEMLQSRVDALQSLANASEVHPADLYLKKIDQLEREILEEKRKTSQLEIELASFKKLFSEQRYKQNNADNVVTKGNFTVEETPKEREKGENDLLDHSCIITHSIKEGKQ